MMTRFRRHRGWLLCVLTATMIPAGCIYRSRVATRADIDAADGVSVATPVRAHLADGAVILYRAGLRVAGDSLHGAGVWYSPLRTDSMRRDAPVALAGVVGLESFDVRTDYVTSTAVSLLGTAAIAVGLAAGAIAIFGSCPTVYAMTPSGEVLEAELFSYSVAYLLEGRDVDVLRAVTDVDGRVELEIRNEALETHHINHLELLEVRHGRDEYVVPDERGRPLVLANIRPVRALDRTGRDVTTILAERDSAHYVTAQSLLASPHAADLYDHIDLVVPKPHGRDSVAVVFRLRNSLLNTVLFYDLMLGASGARALDWLGSDLQRIGPAVELGEWYASRMGLRVSVFDGGEYREVGRVSDSGPIAWHEVAVLVPVPATADSLRVRLSFVMDEWRIDRASIAFAARRADPRIIAPAEVLGADGAAIPEAVALLADPDEHYLVTAPGRYVTLRFAAGAAPAEGTRTFMLSSQGYYTEWIRPAWVRDATTATAFVPDDERLAEALERWQQVRPAMERRFFATRIPVR